MTNIALIGCGRISHRHIEAIQDNPSLNIAVTCDLNLEKAQSAAERTGARATSNYLDIPEVDIAVVLTPSGLHPRHTIDIAENTNVPMVVTEKPISLTVRETLELFTRMDQTGKRLLPVFQNRYNPLVAYMRDLIQGDKLGKIYHFVCNVIWNRGDHYFDDDWHGTRELDGGVLYTQASHYVDMLHYFFGETESFEGFGGTLRNLEVYDSLAAVMKFKNGVVGTLNASVDAYEKNYATEFTLITEKGNIHLSGTNLNTVNHWNVNGIPKPDLDFHITHEYGKGHNTLYRHIVDQNWDAFPSREDILAGIHMMERLSYS